MRATKAIRATTAAMLALLTMAGPALAASGHPGTPAEVAAAVAYSPQITSLDPTVEAELPNAVNDLPWHIYGSAGANGCATLSSCDYGSGGSRIVLFGDSHAMMWLPAVVPWARAHGYQVDLVWERGCPIAHLPTAWSFNGTADVGFFTNAQCKSWVIREIRQIKAAHPALVLLGERTAGAYSQPSGVPFTSDQWQSALEWTLRDFGHASLDIAVIEDAPWHNTEVPACLAANLDNVQECSVPFPNPAHPGFQTAEQAAASAEGDHFIPTSQWLCTKDDATCSPIIGRYITYRDAGHLSASYAAYLSTAMGDEIRSVL